MNGFTRPEPGRGGLRVIARLSLLEQLHARRGSTGPRDNLPSPLAGEGSGVRGNALQHGRRAAGDTPTILLEGSWPCASDGHRSLESSLDGRYEWIDVEASRIAASLESSADDNPFWYSALALRYYVVKLLRVAVFFGQIEPLRAGQTVELIAARDHDADYADLLGQLAREAGAELHVRWIDAPAPPPRSARHAPWGTLETCQARWKRAPRQAAGWLAGWFEPALTGAGEKPRVVLCGNPHLLDPVCRELVGRGARVWWLYERWAARTWLRWRPWGVGQIVCGEELDLHESRRAGFPARQFVSAAWEGRPTNIDLAPALSMWITRWLDANGRRMARIQSNLDEAFARLRPTALVLDEDATALHRAAILTARRYGTRSLVVQHGVPGCRFGFAPAAADRVLVWGESSRRQLIDWGVHPNQVHVTGSPRRERLAGRVRRNPRAAGGPVRILLLATVPPRDERPDALVLNLSRTTYAAMLRMAVSAVSELEDAELTIKLHPRAAADRIAESMLSEFPEVRARIVRHPPLEHWLARSDCVLSCLSSAGVDAAVAGLPVIQLQPSGSGDVMPADAWGFVASVRTEAELKRALASVLSGSWSPAGPLDRVMSIEPMPAARRIVDEVLTRRELRSGGVRPAIMREVPSAGQARRLNENPHECTMARCQRTLNH